MRRGVGEECGRLGGGGSGGDSGRGGGGGGSGGGGVTKAEAVAASLAAAAAAAAAAGPTAMAPLRGHEKCSCRAMPRSAPMSVYDCGV